MIGLLLLAFTPSTSFETGNSLLRLCQSTSLEVACTGYVSGVADAATAMGLICLPQTVERAQVRDVIVRDLNSHPETRHMPAVVLVTKSLKDIYPCSK